MLGTLLTYINKRDLVHICVVLGTDHYFLGRGVGGGGEGGWKFSQASKQFLCLRLPANTFFYLQTFYFSVYSLCKQFIS